VIAVYVRTSDSGLPWWQVLPLTVVGILIATGILRGFAWLLASKQRRAFRERTDAVAAAAGDDPVYNVAALRAVAQDLFTRMWAAWDAVDRDRLSEFGTAEIVEDWNESLDRHRADGHRMRVEISEQPAIDIVGLNNGYVTARVRAKLRAYLETPDGKRKPVAEARGSKTWKYDYFWTFFRDGDRWRISWVRDQSVDQNQALEEEIVADTAGRR
jgi:predicted lipid-binding transport protein (Tim44 family)